MTARAQVLEIAEEQEWDLGEPDMQVVAWRTEQFLRLGFSESQSACLGNCTDVHHSYAKRMLDHGATLDEAWALLS